MKNYLQGNHCLVSFPAGITTVQGGVPILSLYYMGIFIGMSCIIVGLNLILLFLWKEKRESELFKIQPFFIQENIPENIDSEKGSHLVQGAAG